MAYKQIFYVGNKIQGDFKERQKMVSKLESVGLGLYRWRNTGSELSHLGCK